MSRQVCGRCRHFLANETTQGTGFCRYNPPEWDPYRMHVFYKPVPMTFPACGQFQYWREALESDAQAANQNGEAA